MAEKTRAETLTSNLSGESEPVVGHRRIFWPGGEWNELRPILNSETWLRLLWTFQLQPRKVFLLWFVSFRWFFVQKRVGLQMKTKTQGDTKSAMLAVASAQWRIHTRSMVDAGTGKSTCGSFARKERR